MREELATAETDMLKRHDLALFKLKDFEMEINFHCGGCPMDRGALETYVEKAKRYWIARIRKESGSTRAPIEKAFKDLTAVLAPKDVLRPP